MITRRDFIKLSGTLPLGMAATPFMDLLDSARPAQNILVVLFDALSAANISLYGYARETMPNLTRLSKRAVVYHNHFASSNFTTSGTASLLTGTLPWTNRALRPNGTVAKTYENQSIFAAFSDYHRIAYTHNSWAYTLLRQFQRDIEELIPPPSLFLPSLESLIDAVFHGDQDLASVAWGRATDFRRDYAYSLLLSHAQNAVLQSKIADLEPFFPRGLPMATGPYMLEQAVAWLKLRLQTLPQPFLGYFHFLPPHAPYNTSVEFYKRFATDGYRAVKKPLDIFAEPGVSEDPGPVRKKYDEYVLYADKGFGDLYEALRTSGMLENTWLVLTSDHGEMLERGMVGHREPSLYQPVIRVPLVIFEPGSEVGVNIHNPTSAIDVLPTLLQVTGRPLPEWNEGVVLPPFAPQAADPKRRLFAMVAKLNGERAPLTHASTTIITERYKLLYYFGYPDYGIDELVKLYDIQGDPEELEDLALSERAIKEELFNELKTQLAIADKPYL